MSRRGENIFKRKDGRWEGRYKNGYHDNGKTKYSSVYAHSYAECSQKLQVAKNNQFAHTRHINISQLFEEWLVSRKNTVKQSTCVHYKTLFDNYIKSHFKKIKTENVTSFMLNRYVSELIEKDGLSSNTVQAVLVLLKSMFKYAENVYEIRNPFINVAIPKTNTREVETFTQAEIEIIRNHALTNDSSKLGILLCIYTGMRIGEICALKWSDIDLNTQLITVNKTLQRIKNPNGNIPKTIVTIDTPKTQNSLRKIPVPTFMLMQLASLKKLCKSEAYFLSCKSKCVEPRAYREQYKSFLKSVGLPYRNFHVLRHTFATECISCGIDVKTVSELLGHSSVKITLDRYVHSSMENKRKQLEKLYAL